MELIHDKEKRSFILPLENGMDASVDYTLKGNKMDLVYSQVPIELRGQGVGKKLVEQTFEKLTQEGYEAVAICSYIKVIARRSNKWKNIIK